MSGRKQQILQNAIDIISDEGYARLSMRSLARASGMKLGALQYHFPTREELLRALVDHIATAYRQAFAATRDDVDSVGVRELAVFMLNESLFSDRLWPQLWAMQQIEPLVANLLDDVYAECISRLELALANSGSRAPHTEALCLTALFEGELLLTGRGRRWESDRKAVRDAVLEFIDDRYGEKP